jgi:hypothetical protein
LSIHNVLSAVVLAVIVLAAPAGAEQPVKVAYSRQQLEDIWRDRIRSVLDRGAIPLIDFESFLPRENGKAVVKHTMKAMDELGVGLIILGGYKAAHGAGKGYRWGYYIHEVVNAHPEYFVLATNKGGNRNWWAEKGGKPRHFIDQLEQQVRGGDYPFISELEFRHYMSNAQCRAGKTQRDEDIPLNGRNGHRLFGLSAETGVAFSIHLEPEDGPLDALEEMLAAYPQATVVIAHFGQIRHPEREQRFTPKLVRRLLTGYPNLYFDLSVGEPGRRYACGARVRDTVIWATAPGGGQADRLDPEYEAILTAFSGRFVAGFDFGPANRQTETHLHRRIANIRLILGNLPVEARHDIAYRNGWKLLTGRQLEVVDRKTMGMKDAAGCFG